jgi:hypothetical protein
MDFRDIEIFNRKLRVYSNGDILVKRYNLDEFYEKKCYIRNGYKHLTLTHGYKQKAFQVHRIIAYTYLGLDIDNPKILIDHIDRYKLNNCVSNLRLVSHQQNNFNKNVKGYCWVKQNHKWKASLKLDGKNIYLGYFELEEDARNAYLIAKEKYHII